jgi:hypothetical protein
VSAVLVRALSSVTVLIVALVLGACAGGGDSEDDVKASLDQALRGSIASADVNLDAQISIQGLKGFERPVRIQATGPYIAARRTIPKVDLDITAGSPEAGQTIQAGFLSTGDRAFVKFGSGYYEQPRADVARANRQLRRRAGANGRGGFAGLGLEPRDWVVDAVSRGDAKVAGVEVERFGGKLDLAAMFTDLNRFVERSANVVGGSNPDVPRPLTKQDIDRLASIVDNPTFEIYVGKDDGLVRRIAGNLKLSVPTAERSRFGGISGGSLKFSLELSNVDGDQEVVAPRDSRPISDLRKALGGIGALSGAGALGGDDSATGTDTESTPAPSGTGTEPNASGIQAYSDCLDKAQPSDIKALDRCRDLLK